MICERDEEPYPSATTQWIIIMACTCYRVTNTHCL
jgi:hypothetical protein